MSERIKRLHSFWLYTISGLKNIEQLDKLVICFNTMHSSFISDYSCKSLHKFVKIKKKHLICRKERKIRSLTISQEFGFFSLIRFHWLTVVFFEFSIAFLLD